MYTARQRRLLRPFVIIARRQDIGLLIVLRGFLRTEAREIVSSVGSQDIGVKHALTRRVETVLSLPEDQEVREDLGTQVSQDDPGIQTEMSSPVIRKRLQQ